MSRNDNQASSHFLDELTLYYEEIRDVNAKTLSIAKMLGTLYLALFTYMLVGTRYATDPSRMISVLSASPTHQGNGETAPTDSTRHIFDPFIGNVAHDLVHVGLVAYGMIGVFLCTGLCLLSLQSIHAFGRSKFLKTRYWKTISILRKHLHDLIIPDGSIRVVALQTGEELVNHPPFTPKVPRPRVGKHLRFFGYFLGLINITVFTCACTLFAFSWDIGWHLHNAEAGTYSTGTSLWRALSRALTGSLGLTFLHLVVIHKYFVRDVLRSQFISRKHLDPHIKYHDVNNFIPNLLAALVFGVAIATSFFPFIVDFAPRNWAMLFHVLVSWKMRFYIVICCFVVGVLIRIVAVGRFRYTWRAAVLWTLDPHRLKSESSNSMKLEFRLKAIEESRMNCHNAVNRLIPRRRRRADQPFNHGLQWQRWLDEYTASRLIQIDPQHTE